MRATMNTIAAVLALALLTAALPAGDAAAPEEDKGAKLTVTVKSVKGTVKQKDGSDPKGEWKPVKVGDTLDEETVLSTGFRSEAKLEFGDNSVLVVGAATQVGIAHCRKHPKVTRTEVDLKYGTLDATIHKAKGPNDYRVVTPVATCAAIGTGGRIKFDVVHGMLLAGNSGVWGVFQGFNHKSVRRGELSNGHQNSPDLKKNIADLHKIDFSDGLSDAEKKILKRYGAGRNRFRLLTNDRKFRRTLRADLTNRITFPGDSVD